LRKTSPTYKKWFSIELSAENKTQLYVPKGFAHGYITLEDDTEIMYKVDAFYSKEHEVKIRYDDPDIHIDWGNTSPVLSDQDLCAFYVKDIDFDF